MSSRYITIILFVLGSFIFQQANAQQPKAHKMTDAEIKLHAKRTLAVNEVDKLSVAAKTKAADRGRAMSALILKAILHRADPAAYPMDAQTPSVEKNVWEVVQKISPALFDTIAVKAKETINNPVKKTALLGKWQALDFKKTSLLADIKKEKGFEFSITTNIPKMGQVETTTYGFNKVDIEINSIDCIARTTLANPYDRMVLTGLLLGASGNTNDANSVVACEMVDGISCDMGSMRFGTYSLHSTYVFPKTFYCILVLVRSGREDPTITKNLFDIIMSLVSAANVSPDQTMDEMAASVTECMNSFSDNWSGDDRPLIPFPVKLQLNNINVAAANNGPTDELQTGDILEFGNPERWGKYKIAYQWRIRK